MKLIIALSKAANALRRENIKLEAIGDLDAPKEALAKIDNNLDALETICRLMNFIKESE